MCFTMVNIIQDSELIRWCHRSEWETLMLEKCVYTVEIPSGLRQDEAESARPSHSTAITQWDASPVWSGSTFTGWSESCGIPASSPTLRKQPLHGCSPAPRFYGSSASWDFFPGSAWTLKFSTLLLNNKRRLFRKWQNHHPISPSSKCALLNRSCFNRKKEKENGQTRIVTTSNSNYCISWE